MQQALVRMHAGIGADACAHVHAHMQTHAHVHATRTHSYTHAYLARLGCLCTRQILQGQCRANPLGTGLVPRRMAVDASFK